MTMNTITKPMLEVGQVLAAAEMVRHVASQVQTRAAARKLDEAYLLIRDAFEIVEARAEQSN
jgi:hypothetical protein